MSKYNHYAVELDKAFKAARDEYKTMLNALEDARKQQDSARSKRGPEGEIARAKAKAAYLEAVGAIKTGNPWNAFFKRQDELEKALAEEIGLNRRADPDAVDPNALALLNAGFMSADDYFGFADKYSENPTMLRLIANYARDAADGMDVKDRAALLTLAHQCKSGEGKVMQAWHALTDTARYCSGQRHGAGEALRASYNAQMGDWWERTAADEVANF